MSVDTKVIRMKNKHLMVRPAIAKRMMMMIQYDYYCNTVVASQPIILHCIKLYAITHVTKVIAKKYRLASKTSFAFNNLL